MMKKRKANVETPTCAPAGERTDRAPSYKIIKTTKPILVVLPGASGSLERDFGDLLVVQMNSLFEVRVYEGKWKGWNSTKNAKVVVDSLCPQEQGASPWYILGVSFGCRVATAIVAENLTPVAPHLIFCGYPLYGPKGDDERLRQIQALPETTHLLCISGEQDEFITKNVPKGKLTGLQLWESVITTLQCHNSTSVHLIPEARHSVLPSSHKDEAITSIIDRVKAFMAHVTVTEW